MMDPRRQTRHGAKRSSSSEHKMKLVMGISDRLIVLHHGELLAEGTPDEIRRNETVRARLSRTAGEH